MRKINVLQFITPAGFYGAEMWVIALARNIDRERINCRLVVTKESETQSIELYNRYRELSLDAEKILMNGRFDLRSIFKLSDYIKKNKIDIIHTHGYKSDIIGLAAAKIAGIKAVSTPHGFENAKDLKLQLFIWLGCRALKYFDIVAPLSDELERDIRKIGVSPGKIRFIQNGVDLSEIETVRKNINVKDRDEAAEKRICYVGQMASRKNVADMIKTFDALYHENDSIRLYLIGDGPQKNELESLAKSLSSGKKIEFLGYRKDRLEFVKDADLFTMTSSLEGIPRCMMEAMAIEIPIAAFNISGIDKLIINEHTGLTADFGDIEGLKNAWKKVLFDKETARRLAQNAREHILNNFSAKRMADEYMSLFKEMISRKCSVD